jgi:hypothetical protein
VAAADSPPEFHEPVDALASALPNARTVLVEGGHIIDPAAPEVVAFVADQVGGSIVRSNRVASFSIR